MNEVMDLVIDRSRWLRGSRDPSGTQAPSCLLDAGGNMCCVGFYCLALGIPTKTIRLYTVPSKHRHIVPVSGHWLFDTVSLDRRSKELEELFSLNDMGSFADPDREPMITEIFARHGVRVTFVDGVGP